MCGSTELSLKILPLKNDLGGAFSAAARPNEQIERIVQRAPPSPSVPIKEPSGAVPSAPLSANTSPVASPVSPSVISPTPNVASVLTASNPAVTPAGPFVPQPPSSNAPPRSPKPIDTEAPPPPPPRQPEDGGSVVRGASAEQVNLLIAQAKERDETIAKLQAELEREREKVKRLTNALRVIQGSVQAALEP